MKQFLRWAVSLLSSPIFCFVGRMASSVQVSLGPRASRQEDRPSIGIAGSEVPCVFVWVSWRVAYRVVVVVVGGDAPRSHRTHPRWFSSAAVTGAKHCPAVPAVSLSRGEVGHLLTWLRPLECPFWETWFIVLLDYWGRPFCCCC